MLPSQPKRVRGPFRQRTQYAERISADFPWCGLLINMKNLSVVVDYRKYSGQGTITFRRCCVSRLIRKDIKDSLTVDKGRKPGAVFAYKMLW